jgi:hypothetical protein
VSRALAPRLFVVATAAAIGVAGLRVASVPTPQAEVRAPYTWDSVVTEIRADLDATVAGLRRTTAQQKAQYTKMWQDTQVLERRLGSDTPGG